jgi:hypothetical protein
MSPILCPFSIKYAGEVIMALYFFSSSIDANESPNLMLVREVTPAAKRRICPKAQVSALISSPSMGLGRAIA